MGQKKKKKGQKALKPPFFKNPKQELEQVKSKMNPKVSEPTQDTFSQLGETKRVDHASGEMFDTERSSRPTAEGKFNFGKWAKKNVENIILFPIIAAIIGFIYDANSRLSVAETKIESTEGDIGGNETKIEKNEDDISDIQGDLKLLHYINDQEGRTKSTKNNKVSSKK